MLTAIAGMPGSGKSHLIQSLPYEVKIDDCLYMDDHENRFTLVEEAVRNNKVTAVSDIQFCLAERRQWFEDIFGKVEWIFFANDPQTCIRNVLRRENNEATWFIGVIKRLSEQYDPPANALPVWDENAYKHLQSISR